MSLCTVLYSLIMVLTCFCNDASASQTPSQQNVNFLLHHRFFINSILWIYGLNESVLTVLYFALTRGPGKLKDLYVDLPFTC